MSELRKELVKRLERIPVLEDRPSKVAGGSAIFYKDKEIAHFHDDNEIDVRLTKQLIRSEGSIPQIPRSMRKDRRARNGWSCGSSKPKT